MKKGCGPLTAGEDHTVTNQKKNMIHILVNGVFDLV
jgi:hypothetical protein